MLVSGVTILSLKSSAKHAPDPYTVTAHGGDSVRMRPRMPRGRSGTPGDGADPDEDGSGKSKAAEEGRMGTRRGTGEEGEVLWEVGSVSDDEDEEQGKEGTRKGIGGGDMRGERRGLLVDEEEAEAEGDGGSRSTATRREGEALRPPSEAERNPFADEDGFGEYEGGGQSGTGTVSGDKVKVNR